MQWYGVKKAPLVGAFLFVCLSATVWAAGPRLVEVKQIIDGDSLRLSSGEQVRLIGINTPEMVGDDGQPEALAEYARKSLARLIGNRRVRLILDHEKRDRHRRQLAYVETADGRDVQQHLLSEGLAFLVAIPPNLARLNRYQAAQEHARSAGRGIWGVEAFAPIAADTLNKNDAIRGFKQIRGTVKSFHASRHNYYFRLSPGFELKIPKAYWVYFQMQPEQLVNETIITRGWVTRGKYRLQIRMQHPAMLEIES